MITEIVLLNFIFWEILCHTGYPTESLGFSQRKIDVDFPFCHNQSWILLGLSNVFASIQLYKSKFAVI